ncbi:MAG: hypothetical protein ACK4GK_06195 [Ferrovibrio sp.]
MPNYPSFVRLSIVASYLKSRYSIWRTRRIHALHRRQHEAAYAEIDTIIRRFHDAGGLKHDFQAYKLFELSSLLSKHRPKKILELGSGTTTAVFSNYVRQDRGSSLTVIDESQHWLDNARRLAQIDDFDKRFDLIVAPKIEEWVDSTPIARYDVNITGEYDFILVDGPSLTIGGVKDKRAVNTNILPIIDRQETAIILVDIRAATVDAMLRHALDHYKITRSDIITGNLRPGYNYFTRFEKRLGV